MTSSRPTFLLITILALFPLLAMAQTRRKPEFVIAGYLPDYKLANFDAATARQVTDFIYFSIEPKPDGSLDTTRCGPEVLAKLREIKKQSQCRILIALGGWERSNGFAPVAKDPTLRATFAKNLAQFCRNNGFDGVDFDWEHPKDEGEARNYGALVSEARRAFRPHRLLVSVTLATAKHLDAEGYRAANRIQIMSYDHPGKHSTFAQMQADVETLLKAGCPPAKLIPGMPFYGRSLANWNQALSYADIVEKFAPETGADEAGGFYFNNVSTIQQKTRYSLEKGMGGVMFWELGQDTRDARSLLRAIRQTVAEAKEGEGKP